MNVDTLAQACNDLAVAAHGTGFAWPEQCERQLYYDDRAARGVWSGVTYATARAALAASDIVSLDLDTAPAGASAFYDRSADGHTVLCLGHGYCLNTSPLTAGQAIKSYGRGLYLGRLSDYLPFGASLGWSYNHGRRAQVTVDPYTPPTPAPTPVPAAWTNVLPSQPVGLRIQRGLRARGRYAGPINGVWGPFTWKGVQTTARYGNDPYAGPIDGVPGPNTIRGVQGYAQRWGGYVGPVDGVAGPNTWACFARALGQ